MSWSSLQIPAPLAAFRLPLQSQETEGGRGAGREGIEAETLMPELLPWWVGLSSEGLGWSDPLSCFQRTLS